MFLKCFNAGSMLVICWCFDQRMVICIFENSVHCRFLKIGVMAFESVYFPSQKKKTLIFTQIIFSCNNISQYYLITEIFFKLIHHWLTKWTLKQLNIKYIIWQTNLATLQQFLYYFIKNTIFLSLHDRSYRTIFAFPIQIQTLWWNQTLFNTE